jgi:hypothetical protein
MAVVIPNPVLFDVIPFDVMSRANRAAVAGGFFMRW